MFSSKWKYLCLPAIIPAIILFISWISPVKTVMPTETIHPVSSGSLENRNWELAEIRFLQENQSYYFKKNDHEASSIELEGDYYRFESNGTGLYQQADGKQFRLNWKYLE